jgi:ATP/maltotriose-dependent transcriptional regulator MalT
VEELTPKEKETLGLIAIGSSNKEIAEALGVSVNTVKTHVLSIYGKLNVSRRSQAAIKAKDLNLVD